MFYTIVSVNLDRTYRHYTEFGGLLPFDQLVLITFQFPMYFVCRIFSKYIHIAKHLQPIKPGSVTLGITNLIGFISFFMQQNWSFMIGEIVVAVENRNFCTWWLAYSGLTRFHHSLVRWLRRHLLFSRFYAQENWNYLAHVFIPYLLPKARCYRVVCPMYSMEKLAIVCMAYNLSDFLYRKHLKKRQANVFKNSLCLFSISWLLSRACSPLPMSRFFFHRKWWKFHKPRPNDGVHSLGAN